MSKIPLVAVFLVISILLPLIWLRDGFIYIGEENLFLGYQIVLKKALYAWSDWKDFGGPVTPGIHAGIIPNALFYWMFLKVGLGISQIQTLFIQVFLFLTFLSVQYFLKLFTNEKKVLFLGSLFYIFTFYLMGALWYSAKMYQLLLMPVLFVWFYKYLKTWSYKYAFLNFVAFFLLQAVFINLPQVLSTLLVYPIAFFYFTQEAKKAPFLFFRQNAPRIFGFFLLLFPIFFYHALVYYFSFTDNFVELKAEHTFSALKAPLHDILQLRGSWWEEESYMGIYYNHWCAFFDSPFVVLSSFSLIFFIFYLLQEKLKDKSFLFWFFLFLLFVAISSGTVFLPQIYQMFYEHVPFFYIFREPWAKFMPFVILSMSVLLVLSFKKVKSSVVYSFLLFVLLVRIYPFLSPSLFDYRNVKWKKLFIKPPDYWYHFEEWSQQNSDYYVLPFPNTLHSAPFYKWYDHNLGNSTFPVYLIFGEMNTFSGNYALSSPGSIMIKAFTELDSIDFIKIGKIDYIFDQRDALLNDVPYEGYLEYSAYVEPSPSEVFSDKLFLYKVKSEFVLPLIYGSCNSYIEKDMDSLVTLVRDPSFVGKTPVFIETHNSLDVKPLSCSLSEVDIKYEKVTPVKYTINFLDAPEEFYLTFNANFNKRWIIYDESNRSSLAKIIMEDVSKDNHFVANGFANSWLLSGNEGKKTTLVLEYWPQRLFSSIFGLELCILVFSFGYFVASLIGKLWYRKGK